MDYQEFKRMEEEIGLKKPSISILIRVNMNWDITLADLKKSFLQES